MRIKRTSAQSSQADRCSVPGELAGSQVFTPARIRVLKLLASHAAMVLQNTSLYRGLVDREAKRKRVEMRFAHHKIHHGFERMQLRGLSGARDEFHLAAIVQNLKTMALHLLGARQQVGCARRLPKWHGNPGAVFAEQAVTPS